MGRLGISSSSAPSARSFPPVVSMAAVGHWIHSKSRRNLFRMVRQDSQSKASSSAGRASPINANQKGNDRGAKLIKIPAVWFFFVFGTQKNNSRWWLLSVHTSIQPLKDRRSESKQVSGTSFKKEPGVQKDVVSWDVEMGSRGLRWIVDIAQIKGHTTANHVDQWFLRVHIGNYGGMKWEYFCAIEAPYQVQIACHQRWNLVSCQVQSPCRVLNHLLRCAHCRRHHLYFLS